MVNYKRAVCELGVLSALLAVAFAAPAPDTDKHYDQRQNGTENYRLNIDGVVIAVAPAEAILEAVSDFGDIFDISGALSEHLLSEASLPSSGSPAKPEASSDSKPVPEKPAETPLSDVSLNTDTKAQRKDASAGKQEKAQRLKHRLASVLLPLLKKNRHH